MKLSIAYEIEIEDDRLAVEIAKLVENNKSNFSTELVFGDKFFFANPVSVSLYAKRKYNQWSGPWHKPDPKQIEMKF